jgi:hypothetical protein
MQIIIGISRRVSHHWRMIHGMKSKQKLITGRQLLMSKMSFERTIDKRWTK